MKLWALPDTHRSCRKRARGSPGHLRMTKGKTCLTLTAGKNQLWATSFCFCLLRASPLLTYCLQHKPSTAPLGSCPHTDHVYGMDPIHTPFKYAANSYSPAWPASTWWSRCEHPLPCAWNTGLPEVLRNLLQHSVEQTQRPLCYNTCSAAAPLLLPTLWGHRGKELAAAQNHSQGQSISLVPGSKRALYVGQPQQGEGALWPITRPGVQDASPATRATKLSHTLARKVPPGHSQR